MIVKEIGQCDAQFFEYVGCTPIQSMDFCDLHSFSIKKTRESFTGKLLNFIEYSF